MAVGWHFCCKNVATRTTTIKRFVALDPWRNVDRSQPSSHSSSLLIALFCVITFRRKAVFPKNKTTQNITFFGQVFLLTGCIAVSRSRVWPKYLGINLRKRDSIVLKSKSKSDMNECLASMIITIFTIRQREQYDVKSSCRATQTRRLPRIGNKPKLAHSST